LRRYPHQRSRHATNTPLGRICLLGGDTCWKCSLPFGIFIAQDPLNRVTGLDVYGRESINTVRYHPTAKACGVSRAHDAKELRTECVRLMTEEHMKPVEVVAWLKAEHKVDVGYACVYAWLPHKPKPKKVKAAGAPPEFADGCKFSLPPPTQKDQARDESMCAIGRMPCGGSALCKNNCPLRNGTARFC